MSRNMWIMAALLTILVLANIWSDTSGKAMDRWEMCKESLVTQIFTGDCTLRFEDPKIAS